MDLNKRHGTRGQVPCPIPRKSCFFKKHKIRNLVTDSLHGSTLGVNIRGNPDPGFSKFRLKKDI